MTKLDEILDARDNLRGKETDGGYMGNKPMLTKSEAKQQIKELFLELIDDPDLGLDNIKILRTKVEEL